MTKVAIKNEIGVEESFKKGRYIIQKHLLPSAARYISNWTH